jgi:hypothetical protein
LSSMRPSSWNGVGAMAKVPAALWVSFVICALFLFFRYSGMVRQHQTSDVQLHIGESLDSGFDAEPVIGPAIGRTRWHRPGMTFLTSAPRNDREYQNRRAPILISSSEKKISLACSTIS